VDEPLQIDLRQGGNREAWLGRGWGLAEPHGSWTVGRDATLLLPGLDDPPDWVMALLVRPYLGPPHAALPFQDLVLFVNEIRVLTRRLEGPQMIRLAIPDGAVAPHGPITLRLRCPGATAPRALSGGGDARLLGVSVISLSFARRPSTVDP
jgi:hypothetical protein